MSQPSVEHAIVTGGTSGIGLGVVRRLVGQGSRVSVLALDNADMAALAADRPRGLHPPYLAAADVTDRAAVDAAVAAALAHHGPADLLVTCAGVVRPGRFLELEPEEFEREMRVNYLGTVWPAKAVAPVMAERGRGAIVMVASFAGILGVNGYSAYAPTKFAVRGLAEVLRAELRRHGVHVAAVFPTDVDTPMLAYEEPLKPWETRALSGTAATMTVEQVVDAILGAVPRRRARVLCDRQSTMLARIAGAAPGLSDRIIDRIVDRAAPPAS